MFTLAGVPCRGKLWGASVCVAACALAYDPRAMAGEPKIVALLVAAIVLAALGAARVVRFDVTLPLALGCVFALYGLGRGGRDALGALIAALVLGLWVAGLPPAERRSVWRCASVTIGTGAGVIATVQWLGGARGMALHGGVGNPNWLGLLLAVTLVPTLSALIHAARVRARATPLWFACAALQGSAWVLAESRAAWIALPVGLVFTRAPRHRQLGWALCVALALASLAATRVSLGGGAGAATALAGRFWIWKASLAAGMHALPFGTGIQEFPGAYLVEQGRLLAGLPIAEASRSFVHASTAHNEWLHAYATLGPVGAALLVALLATGINEATPDAAGALGALAVAASADVPLHVPAVAVVMALALSTGPRFRRRAIGAHPRRALALGSLALCAVLLLSGVRQWRGTRLLTLARDALPAERASLLRQAAALAPRSARAQFEWGSEQIASGQFESGLVALRRSRELSAAVSTEVAIGNALLELDQPSEARQAYLRALSFNPGSFRAHANLSAAYLKLGDPRAAETELAKAEQLWPGHPKLPALREAIRRKALDQETAPVH